AQWEKPSKQPNNMSMEEMLKMIMAEQAQLATDEIMSSSQRPGKQVATSSQRKRVWSGGNVPPAPAVPRGQTRQFGMKDMTKEGKT
ncbi:hypothetical protein H5410_026863, partial [Solanum commersonii]